MKKWMPLFSTQFLGVLNDNFLKNAIIFVAMFWLAEEDQGMVIPIASALLVIPFVFLSPLAGKMSQERSKQKIYEWAKLAEIPIMILAVAGFFMESMWIVMAALLLMGIQSALYAPSKYGLIRDIGGTSGLSFGVGTMELLTFIGVLIGQIAAGIISDMSRGITMSLSAVLIGLAIFGYITARMIKANEEQPVEKSTDPVDPFTFTYKTAKWAKTIKGLNTTILGLGGFWLVAAMIQMNIYEHAPKIYELSNTATAIVMALIAIGIGLGCFLAGKLSKNRVELGMVPLGGLGLSIILTIFATAELTLYPFVICLVLAALFSGFYKVPLSAWIQERVEGRKLGLALAYNQLMAFLFILVAAGIFGYVVNEYDTYAVFMVLAVISWIMTLITLINIPAMMIRFVAYLLAKLYYKIEVTGGENIPRKSGALVVANHLSLMDPFLVVTAVPRMLRFVMARGIYEIPVVKPLMKKLNMIPISGKLDKERLEEFNEICRKEVNNGHVLCIFPEGQISRIGHMLEFKKGIEHIAKGAEVPIIPVQMSGVHGTFLAFNVGSSKPVTRFFRSFRKHISINIGEPVPPTSKASMLRQKVQYLNARNMESRIREKHTLPYFMRRVAKKSGNKVFLDGNAQFTFSEFLSKAKELSGFWETTASPYIGIDVRDETLLRLAHVSSVLSGKKPVIFHPLMEDNKKEEISKSFDIDLLLSDYKKEDNIVTAEQFLSTNKVSLHKPSKNNIAGVFWEISPQNEWYSLELTQQNILASIRGYRTLFDKTENNRILSQIPLSTSYGNLAGLWLPFLFGMTVFDNNEPNKLKEKWQTVGINTLFGEGKVIDNLMKELNGTPLEGLDYVITGGEPVSNELRDKLRSQGTFVSESLGIDKGGVTVSLNTPDYEVRPVDGGKPMVQEGSRNGSYGRMLPGLALRILDDNGSELSPGESGLLSFYGPSLSNTYKNEEGWIDTSLKGHVDDSGFIFLDN